MDATDSERESYEDRLYSFYSERTDLGKSFGQEASQMIYHAMMKLSPDDPLLCIKWSANWHHPDGLDPIIEFIRAHDGEDPQGTGFMFHFSTSEKLARCRILLKQEFPHIFHASDLIRERFHIVDEPIKIGDAWVVTKVLTRDSEHCLHENFFEA